VITRFLSLRSLRSVLRPPLFTVGNPGCVQGSAHHVIPHSGEIFYAASANQHNRVFLQVVSDTWNVSSHLDAIRQAYAGHFAKR